MATMTKRGVISFFANTKFLESDKKKMLIAYFTDFNDDSKFRIKIENSTIHITSLSGELIAFVNVPSK